MTLLTELTSWYLIGLLPVLLGCGVLSRLGLDTVSAWAAGRMVGLVLVAFPIWWLGWLGSDSWVTAGKVLLSLGVIPGTWFLYRSGFRPGKALQAEAIFFLGFLVVLLIRSNRPEIVDTEKLMDVGLITSLLRSGPLPPVDFWLSGRTLQYYYFGPLTWVPAIALSGIPIAIAYNLVVATIGGMIALLSWAIGMRLYDNARSAILCVFLCCLAGTYDGFRQWVTGGGLGVVDMWKSTRLDAGVIMEFPLFTIWLGDLHAHLLVIPLSLTVLLLGIHGYLTGFTVRLTVVSGLLLGGILATSPWSYPPFFGILVLLIVFSPFAIDDWKSGFYRVTALFTVSCIAVLPFLLAYRPAIGGFNLVLHGTGFPDLLSFAGILLIPVAAAAFQRLSATGADRQHTYAILVAMTAAVVLTAALSQRPSLVLTGALIVILVVVAYRTSCAEMRLIPGLAACGVLLLFLPEIVYVVDAYDPRYERLNTVFKFYLQAWLLLCFAAPWLFRRPGRQTIGIRVLATILFLAACVHPASLLTRHDWDGRSLDGFQWMDPVDRKLVDHLASRQGDEVLLEAVGSAYSRFGRLSSSSGVTAFLGWPGHQVLWRGQSASDEIERRRKIAGKIYSGMTVPALRRLARVENIDLIAVGALELTHYPASALERIRQSGEVVITAGDGFVVRVR